MWKKGLIAGALILLFGLILNWLIRFAFPILSGEYQNTAIFRSFNDPMMVVYFAYPFILGLVLYYLWEKVKKPTPLEFAKLYFLIATIPGMFITYTSMQISLIMIIVWAATGFIQALIAGYVFDKLD